MQRKQRFLASACLAAVLTGLGMLPAGAADSPGSGSVIPRKVFVEGSKLNQPWAIKVDFDNPERTYNVGDQMRIKVTSERDGFLYVFDQDPNGEIVCIFPNAVQASNEIVGGKEVAIGGDKFRLRIGEPAGKEMVIALVTTQPLKSARLDELVDSKSVSPKKISAKFAKKIYVEAMTGDPSLAETQDSADKIKNKFQQDNPSQAKQKAQEYSMYQFDLTTVQGKGSGSGDKEKPKGSGDDNPSQGSGKEKPKGSGDDKPTQSSGSLGKEKPKGSGDEKPTQSSGSLGKEKPKGSGDDKPTQSQSQDDKPSKGSGTQSQGSGKGSGTQGQGSGGQTQAQDDKPSKSSGTQSQGSGKGSGTQGQGSGGQTQAQDDKPSKGSSSSPGKGSGSQTQAQDDKPAKGSGSQSQGSGKEKSE
jgi:hypothetical protein